MVAHPNRRILTFLVSSSPLTEHLAPSLWAQGLLPGAFHRRPRREEGWYCAGDRRGIWAVAAASSGRRPDDARFDRRRARGRRPHWTSQFRRVRGEAPRSAEGTQPENRRSSPCAATAYRSLQAGQGDAASSQEMQATAHAPSEIGRSKPPTLAVTVHGATTQFSPRYGKGTVPFSRRKRSLIGQIALCAAKIGTVPLWTVTPCHWQRPALLAW